MAMVQRNSDHPGERRITAIGIAPMLHECVFRKGRLLRDATRRLPGMQQYSNPHICGAFRCRRLLLFYHSGIVNVTGRLRVRLLFGTAATFNLCYPFMVVYAALRYRQRLYCHARRRRREMV